MRSHGRFRLSSQQMPDGGDGVPRDHAGAAIAHHLADALAHFRLVAVVLAGIAAGFHVHLAASARSQRRIFVELRAFRAHGFTAYRGFGSAGTFMVAGAIQRHHLRDGLLLASSPLRDFRGVLLHAGPPYIAVRRMPTYAAVLGRPLMSYLSDSGAADTRQV